MPWRNHHHFFYVDSLYISLTLNTVKEKQSSEYISLCKNTRQLKCVNPMDAKKGVDERYITICCNSPNVIAEVGGGWMKKYLKDDLTIDLYYGSCISELFQTINCEFPGGPW